MAQDYDLPEAFKEFLEPYYIDSFGEVPPVPLERMRTGAKISPEYNLAQERLRADALYSDVFDKKTSQLFALAILAGMGTPGCYWHAKAARKYGASWEELYKAVEIATFFKGFNALMDAGRAVGKLYEEDRQGSADG